MNRDPMDWDVPMKVAAVAALVAYVTGVVTVAAYTEQLDAASPDLMLFKAQYILTGTVTLLLFLLPALMIYGAIHYVREKYWHLDRQCSIRRFRVVGRKGEIKTKPSIGVRSISNIMSRNATWKYLVRCVLLGGALLATYGLCLAFYSVTLALMTKSFPRIDFQWDLSVVAVYATVAGVVAFCVWFARRRDSSVSREVGIAMLITATAGLTVAFCANYADKVYPLIPEQFGGGRPKQAVLAFTAEGRSEALNLGIPMVGDQSTSQPLKLLYKDDSFYTVRIESIVGIDESEERNKEKPPVKGSIVQVSKSSVAGVKSDSRGPRGSDIEIRAGEKDHSFDEPGDKLVMTFSEAMSTESLDTRWTGDVRPVLIGVESISDEDEDGDGKAYENMIRVYSTEEEHPEKDAGEHNGTNAIKPYPAKRKDDPDKYARVEVGRFETDSATDLLETNEEIGFFRATLNRRGLNIVIKLNESMRSGPTIEGTDMQIEWSTSQRAEDLLGNKLEHDVIVEREDESAG